MSIAVSEPAVPLAIQEYAAFINRVRADLNMEALDLSDFSVDEAGRVTFYIPVVPEPAVVAAPDGCDVV